ncbi:unnamed protein product [Didymodactylos carnosus]|uniref:NAD(+)--protein-arginine ADP-ribosyltransferase n=1 Tax=Didymodactylos carnosus TaxID=1234261 RepID=A0A814DPL4_9BILA|nr:unnamed protein product [Didymodactylos carnosus]CAF1075570.1 unnamed protein product [Didymodactylos carnosus]CAF3730720.1 unnamed protein product [Didymodactylos carnosus]CAF3839395.1 unnamed protein product [Didymodactylos carnosus]
MGSGASGICSTQKHLAQNPQAQTEPSEFYLACLNGEIDKVRELLPTISYQDLNRLEPNGSTPLHAAVSAGHSNIVRLLLQECGCRRDLVNPQGLTAYEEAVSDEIRQLFHRPDDRNRFCDDNQSGIEDIFEVTRTEETEDGEVDDDDEDFSGDKWLKGHATSNEVANVRRKARSNKAIMQSPAMKLWMYGLGKVHDPKVTDVFGPINTMLSKHVTEHHPQFQKCIALAREGCRAHKPEHLLRLYTLETPLYRALADNAVPLGAPLLRWLDKLKPRYFQGVSYRGVKATDEDLRAYRWAWKKKGAIQTKTFCSTSLDRSVAERFAGISSTAVTTVDDKRSILMIFNFPTACDQAINLGKLSDQLPCISDYENEAEVLLLPDALFLVQQIEKNINITTVHLENVTQNASYLQVANNTFQGPEGDWKSHTVNCAKQDLSNMSTVFRQGRKLYHHFKQP